MDLITLFKSHMTVLGNLPTNEPRMTPQMISIVNMAKAGGATHDVINYIHQSQQMEAFCAG